MANLNFSHSTNFLFLNGVFLRSDAVSTSSSSTKVSEASSSTKYNNIFKSAFNRGITFLSKIANSSGSNTPSTSASTSSKPAESEINDHDSSSSETPSDCSSPDSLKTEMIFFKPITREPRTPSSAKPVLLRVPSIRSTASSTDRLLNSPCPSPFFIPITPRRQSAFSFVAVSEEDSRSADTQQVIKPRPTKRKNVKTSPEKSAASPKRIKKDAQPSQKSKKSRQLDVEKPKAEAKTEKRKTRSMEKKNYAEDDDDELFCLPTATSSVRRKTLPKSSPKKSPPKKQAEKQPVRVLRSRSMKN